MPAPEQVIGTEAEAAAIAADPDRRAALQRRSLIVVATTQILGGAGLAAGVTAGGLLAQHMLHRDGVAGLPAALFTLGSALAAFGVGQFTQRRGRRLGLGLGFGAGALGALGVVLAAIVASPPLLFIALFVYGSGTATNLQTRYAGTDLATPSRRGKAVSVALVFTTAGAVAGPNLVQPMGRLAATMGIPALAGPFLLSAVAYAGAGTVLLILLRPDPYLVAKHLPEIPATAAMPVRSGPGMGAYIGAAVMVLTQVAMVGIMTMTPVHMRAHQHGLDAVGLVIGMHVIGMYLPSLATGALVDKVGRTAMAIASGGTLLLAGITAATGSGSLPLIIVALMLLGLGWNFGLISGTALVVDATTPGNRARTQGTIDVLIALGGAGGGAASGMIMAATSYAALGLAGGILAVVLIPMIFWYRLRRQTAAA